MRLEPGLSDGPPLAGGPSAAVSIGTFDGVHRGHRAILGRLRDGDVAETAVVTFDPHPRCVLAPEDCPPLLTTMAERAELLEEAGLDRMVVQPFDLEVSRWSADHFMERLEATFRLRRLVVGPDFALGHRRSGDLTYLRARGRQHGFEVATVEPLATEGAPVSSTRIRAALGTGDVEGAAALLGRWHAMDERVVPGERRGRELGFPTANLEVTAHRALPAPGVYACWVRAGGRWWMSATSIGTRPTFGGGAVTVEPHLLDFSGDLYGEVVRCAFVRRLREERAYERVDELVDQMTRDVAATRDILAAAGAPDASQRTLLH